MPHIREEAFELSRQIPDEVRIAVHGLNRLDQVSFSVFVRASHPDPEGMEVDKEAEEFGANAIINVRFVTSQVMTGAAEPLAYGTAVTLNEPR